MFGHHAARRSKKRAKKAVEELELKKKQFEEQAPQRQKEEEEYKKQHIAGKAEEAKKGRQESFEEGVARGKKHFAEEYEGLSPNAKAEMQYGGERDIDRSLQALNRRLLGQQGQRGIVGKGGVGYAQQRDLQRMGMEEKDRVTRDVNKLDRDLALKKQAATFTTGAGEAAQRQLDYQTAEDKYELDKEKQRQRNLEEQFYRQFMRV